MAKASALLVLALVCGSAAPLRIENVTISNLQMFMQEEDCKDKRATGG